ncbi:MAG TPA: hypothetical protein VKM54_21020 [Myxococcota bacterium]|nr:hypothetical protein [Myxococcota bacterium]
MPFRTTLFVGSQSGLAAGTTTNSNGQLVTREDGTSIAAIEVGRLTDLVAEAQVSVGSGGTCTPAIQDSFDGITWGVWVQFTDGAITPLQRVAPTRYPGPYLRQQTIVGAGGSGFTVQTRVCGFQHPA